MKFDYVYFNKNFLKYLELLVYSLKNKRINIIKDLKQVRDIVRNAFHLKDCPPDEKNNLIQTINEYYKGLDTIRTNPLWRSHIDVAITVFNNRLQTTTEIVNSESLKKDNLMISIINELLSNDGRDLDEKKKKKMVSFFERAIQRKSYKLACTFLRRIPKLEKSDVKEIYKCVLEYLIDEYNYTATKNNKCCLQSLITDDFKSDRGPLANMLDDTENPEALKDLFDTWKTIDKDMPLIGNLNNTINPNPRKHVFSCITIISDSEDEDQTYYYSKRARVEPIPRCQTPSLQRSNLGSLQSTPTTSSPSTSNPKLLQNQTPNLQSSSLDLSTSLPNSVGETKKNCPEERNNESAFGDSRHNASSNNKKPEEIIKTGINTPLDTVSSAAPPPINSSSLVNRISSPPTEVFSERRKENLNEKNDAPVQKNDTPVSKNAEQTKQKDNSFVADNTVLYIKTFLAIPQCTLANDFGQLLKTPALSDVVFIVGQEKVKILAHIAIVSARSEVLREKIKEVRKGLKASDDFPVLELSRVARMTPVSPTGHARRCVTKSF